MLFEGFCFTDVLCLQEMHPCRDQTRNRNRVSILLFITLESVHLPVFCRHWSEKHWETFHFTRVCLPLCSKTCTGTKKMEVEVPKPAQEQKQKMKISERTFHLTWRSPSGFSCFCFFVPVQVLALPLSFFVPVQVLELQDAETCTGTKKWKWKSQNLHRNKNKK